MTNKFQNKFRIPSTRLQNWDYCWAGAYFITICTKNREHYFGEIENGEMQLSSVGVIANVMWHEIKNHSKTIELDAFVIMPNHIHGILILNGMDDGDGEINNGGTNNRDNDRDNDDGNENGVNNDVGTNTNTVETGHALSLQLIQPIQPIQPTQSTQSTQSTQPIQPIQSIQPIQPIQSAQPIIQSDQSIQQCQSQQSNQSIQCLHHQPEKTIGQQRFQNIGKNSVSSIIGSYKSAVTKHARRLGFDFAWQRLFHDHIIRDGQSFKRIQTYINENSTKWVDDMFSNF